MSGTKCIPAALLLLLAAGAWGEDMDILWERNISGGGQPLVADVAGDRKPEIVICSGVYAYFYNASGGEAGRIITGEITGNILPLDVDGDGRPELVYSTKDGNVTASDGNGTVLWSYQSGGGITAPVYDNRSKSIVFGSTDKSLRALDLSGIERWKMKVMGGIEYPVLVADADRDGRDEFIFGSDDGTVYDIDRDRGRILAYNIGGGVEGTPQAKDVNLDGRTEIIAVSKSGRVYALVLPAVTDSNRKVSVKWNYTAAGESTSGAAIGDINSDGRYETLFSASGRGRYIEDSALYILNYSGKLLRKYTTNGQVVAPPLIADVNSDGRREASFGSVKGVFYVLNENGSAYWTVGPGGRIEWTPVGYDFDSDRRSEIVVASDSALYLIGSVRDSDGDGVIDYREHLAGTNATNPDSDGDGVNDGADPMPKNNSLKYTDSDGDGLSDYDELKKGIDPLKNDTDGDGITDGKDPKPLENELEAIDSDGDGLSDYREKVLGTDRYSADSDGDGVADGADSEPLYNVRKHMDSDNDTLSDYEEEDSGTDPHREDSDGDGLRDDADPDPLTPEEPVNATSTTQPVAAQGEDMSGAMFFVCVLVAMLYVVRRIPGGEGGERRKKRGPALKRTSD